LAKNDSPASENISSTIRAEVVFPLVPVMTTQRTFCKMSKKLRANLYRDTAGQGSAAATQKPKKFFVVLQAAIAATALILIIALLFCLHNIG
jgi:hypothetical protein